MNVLTPDQAIEARVSLNLSQAKVASDTGINRAYLSQFESGKRVLEDRYLDPLLEYYENQGWKPAPDVEKQPVAQRINSPKHSLHISDGFVIAGSVNSAQEEELLEEYYQNGLELEKLSSEDLPRGFLGGLDENAAIKKSLRPLLLAARQFEIKQILHGQHAPRKANVDPEDSRTVVTVSDYLECLLMNAFPGRLIPDPQ